MVYPVFWVGMVLAAQVPPPNAAAQLSEELHKTHLEILQRESSQLKALADRLAARGEAAGAREVKAIGEVPAPAGCAIAA